MQIKNLNEEGAMIPLRDANPSPGTPIVNYAIIAACTIAFLHELSLGRELTRFLLAYGIVPVRYSDPTIAAHFNPIEQIMPFFSSMFLHGGWLHLIGNMWVLYIFGDNLESALGHGRYLLFYILCGLVAGVAQLAVNQHSSLPTVGASGAIAGVMGAYLILYPRAKILTLVPIFFFFTFIDVPAYIFLGLWFFLQFLSGAGMLLARSPDVGGIAWWAHLGGFICGIALLFLLKPGGARRKWGD
ncbi:MAG: rhomboid family intramembrane serine protease [Syntrophobacteraceae bacterium]